jgi:hypothetical protein
MADDPEVSPAPDAAAPAPSPEPVEAAPFHYPDIGTMRVFEGSQPPDHTTIRLTSQDGNSD